MHANKGVLWSSSLILVSANHDGPLAYRCPPERCGARVGIAYSHLPPMSGWNVVAASYWRTIYPREPDGMAIARSARLALR